MTKKWLFRLAAAALLLIAAGTGERAPGMVTAAGIRDVVRQIKRRYIRHIKTRLIRGNC